MARAHYLYIVTNDYGAILAAFTVKHECVSWLERELAEGRPTHYWDVIRVPDGQSVQVENRKVYGGDTFCLGA